MNIYVILICIRTGFLFGVQKSNIKKEKEHPKNTNYRKKQPKCKGFLSGVDAIKGQHKTYKKKKYSKKRNIQTKTCRRTNICMYL